MSDEIKAKFGDLVENGWASEDNPTRRGVFVRAGRRTGRMNAGRYWEITDGKGKFWELMPFGDHKITVTPADAILSTLQPAVSEEAVEAAAEAIVVEMWGSTQPPWNHKPQSWKDRYIAVSRAALTAALPFMMGERK